MSETPAPCPTPPPQPPATPQDLRAALTQLAPHAVPQFDAEHAQAAHEARQQPDTPPHDTGLLDTAPLRRFTGQWADRVALERHPERAARLADLVRRAEEADTLAEAREALAQISELQRWAHTEAHGDQG